MTSIVNLGVRLPDFLSKKELKQALKELVQQEAEKATYQLKKQ